MEQVDSDGHWGHARFFRDVQGPFVLGEQDIESLVKIMTNFAAEPTISVQCLDAKRPFKKVKHLHEYQNARSQRITSLDFFSYLGRNHSASLAVKNHTNGVLASNHGYATLIVDGPEEKASIAMRQMEGILKGCRLWYPWLRFIGPFTMWGPSYIVVAAMLHLGMLPQATVVPQIIWGFMNGFWLSVAIALMVRILFPLGNVFLIGQGEKRYRVRRTIRKTTGGIVVAILVGVVVNWLVK